MAVKPALVRPARPYRDFLTPVLHRRFTTAALLTLGVCYCIAVWMGPWDLIWQWFPIGMAGVRTLLLFISALAIFMLRITQTHLGKRVAKYPFETLWLHVISFQSIQTLSWYTFSAWWFSEVYIWSAPQESLLGWTDQITYSERPRLNERPVYIRTMMICLAFAQTGFHLYHDYDRVELTRTSSARPSSKKSAKIQTPGTIIRAAVPKMVRNSLSRAISVTIAATAIYTFLLRDQVYTWAYYIVGNMLSLAHVTRPIRFPGLADLMGRFLVESFLLTSLWEFSNVAFSAYFSQEPVKKGRPLTDDSKDPNGSLLLGLKSKKDLVKGMAFRELVIITKSSSLRRKSLYQDIDRKDGAAWNQVLTICLNEIQILNTRLETWESPVLQTQGVHPVALKPLPRLSQPLKADNILKAPGPYKSRVSAAEAKVEKFAKSYGVSPGADPISPRAKRIWKLGTKTILSKQQEENLQPKQLKAQAMTYVTNFLGSPLGWGFRQTFRRRVEAAVCGSPYSNGDRLVDAVDALTGLCVRSKCEDELGTVYKDVPMILRTFMTGSRLLNSFLQQFPPHWTDTEFIEKDRRNIHEIDQISLALCYGVEQLLLTFGEFEDQNGLNSKDIREAKELVDRAKADR